MAALRARGKEIKEADKNCTLFVRNLPWSATNEQFEGLFSDIGPTKQCFIVKKKDEDKCLGYGYVKFSMIEDAEKAHGMSLSLSGRKLQVEYAQKRPNKKSRQGKEEKTEEETEEKKEKAPEKGKAAAADKPATPSAAKDKYSHAKTVVLTGFGSTASKNDVSKLLEQIRNVAHWDFPAPGREEPAALVKFKSVRDAKRGMRKLVCRNLNGKKLKACQMTKENAPQPSNAGKQNRLIIRNMPFKCTSEHLKTVFGKFGTITDITIPTKQDGKKLGFAFVQFSSKTEAQNAFQALDGKPILGRPVSMDWALPKSKFESKREQGNKKIEAKQEKREEDEEDNEEDDEEDNEEEDESEESEDEIPAMGKKLINKMEESEEESETSGSEDSDEDEEDEEDNDDDEEDEEDEEDEDESEEENEEESSDEDTDSGVDSEDTKPSKKKKGQESNKSRKEDVGEGRTVFIRNVPYDAEEEELSELFSQFGDVTFCRLVMDPNTEQPRGTAFVKYENKAAAEVSIEKAESDKDGGLTMRGRRLLVTVAISRQEAQDRQKQDKKEKADNRNLYLAREGMVRPGTQAAIGLSKEDLQRREKIEAAKRAKLKNINYFVSPTRLCVHCLPTSVDDKQLRVIFLGAVNDKAAKITECRVMRDLERVNSQGVGKSRGYAFVQFTQHEHALAALKATNNNPDLLPSGRRLIVEFSVENRQALQAKEKRWERQKLQQGRQQAGDKGQQGRLRKQARAETASRREAAKQQSAVARQSHSGPLGLPSHTGPKVRHRKRQPPPSAGKPSKKHLQGLQSQKQGTWPGKRKMDGGAPQAQGEPRKKKKKKEALMTDDFDRLVQKYRAKMSAAKS